MKIALFTLTTLFGLGLGLAVVGVEFGLLLIAALLVALGLGALLWAFADRLSPLRTTMTRHITAHRRVAHLLLSRWLSCAGTATTGPFLSALLGLALGAALARHSADFPAVLLCGALAAALHFLALGPDPRPNPRPNQPPPQPDRISDSTDMQLQHLISALAPCRDPHLHVAARALRRTAQALAAQVDNNPTTLVAARQALTLWLPALVQAADHLRQHHLTALDPAVAPDQVPDQVPHRIPERIADLTATLVRVTTLLTTLAAPTDTRARPASQRNPGPLARPAH